MPNHPAEYAAATIVASHFRATIDPRDIPGAPPGTHDFDLLLPDGRVIALEITTAADRQTLAVQHQIDPGRQGTPSDKLGSTWIVSVDLPAAKIFPRALAKAVEGMLQVLEDAGVHEVERMRPDEYTVHPASAAMAADRRAWRAGP